MSFSSFLCFSLLVFGYCGVLRNEEDQPLTQNGASCGDQTCPDNQRCELPNLNSECDDENNCPTTPRCVSIPIEKPKCGRNEELKECGSACEPTCQDVEPQCGFQCLTNVCQCKNGFFRDLSSKKCVELDKCANCSLECQDHEKCEFVDLSCDKGECKKTAICTANNSSV